MATRIASAIEKRSAEQISQALQKDRTLRDARLNDDLATPLHLAVSYGKDETTKVLLKLGADVDADDVRQMTPLHYACLNSDLDAIRILCQARADVNAADISGRTPVHYLVKWDSEIDSVKAFEILSKHGLDKRMPANIDALYAAMSSDRKQLASTMLESGFSSDARGESGSLLHLAALNGDSKMIGLLLSKGADLNSVDEFGLPPAACAQTSGLIRRLVRGRTKPFALDTMGNSVLSYVADLESLKILEKFSGNKVADVRGGHQQSLLHDFAPLPSMHGLCRYLLSKGLSPNAKDVWGNTPLHYAAATDLHPTKNVEALLKAGADVNAGNSFGLTPLYMAMSSKVGLVGLLKKRGATLGEVEGLKLKLIDAILSNQLATIKLLLGDKRLRNARDYRGQSAVELSVRFCDNRTTLLLIDAGFEPDAASFFDETPLMVAARMQKLDVVRALISKGANPNSVVPPRARAKTSGIVAGYTPLHYAVTPKSNKALHPQIVELLVKAGARVMPASDGNTPLHICSDTATLRLLLSAAPASLKHRNLRGRTPLHSAAWRKDYKAVAVLVLAGSDQRATDKLAATPFQLLMRTTDPTQVPRSLTHALGKSDLLPSVIKSGVSIDMRDTRNETALHAAARSGDFGTCEKLLELGADPNAQNYNKDTALHVAARHGNSKAVVLLLEKGAKKSLKNIFGNTALGSAHDAHHAGVTKGAIEPKLLKALKKTISILESRGT